MWEIPTSGVKGGRETSWKQDHSLQCETLQKGEKSNMIEVQGLEVVEVKEAKKLNESEADSHTVKDNGDSR